MQDSAPPGSVWPDLPRAAAQQRGSRLALQRRSGRFPDTEWSIVRRAGQLDDEARAQLCAMYWYPVYCFLRSKGANADEARDMTQGIFLMLHEGDAIARIDTARARFRAWLRGVAKNYLFKARAKQQAIKNGGGALMLHVDTKLAEEQLKDARFTALTADQVFDRCWAQTVVHRVIVKLRQQCAAQDGLAGAGDLLESLLSDDDEGHRGPARASAERVRRFRAKAQLAQRFRKLLRDEISPMVEGAAAIDDEIRALLDALS